MRSYGIPIVAVLALVLGGALMSGARDRREAAMRDVPAEVRARILGETLRDLRSICRESYAAHGPLRDHCVERARFVMPFPECDRQCQTAARAMLPPVQPR